MSEENIEEKEEVQEFVDRKDLNIQKFMEDMQMLGTQVRNKDLIKPVFHYGDLGVTNYLLWLLLGELMILNNKNEENA